MALVSLLPAEPLQKAGAHRGSKTGEYQRTGCSWKLGQSVNTAGAARLEKVLHKPCPQRSRGKTVLGTQAARLPEADGRNRGAEGAGLSHKQTLLHRGQRQHSWSSREWGQPRQPPPAGGRQERSRTPPRHLHRSFNEATLVAPT